MEVLQALDQGLLSQKSNAIKGRTSLDVKFLQGRMNFDYLAIHGHSFGAAWLFLCVVWTKGLNVA